MSEAEPRLLLDNAGPTLKTPGEAKVCRGTRTGAS
jgi:hypothetical protein